MSSLLDTLPANIRARRIALGMSRRDLAMSIDKSVFSVKAYESGERVPPSETLILLSRVLSASVEELIQ